MRALWHSLWIKLTVAFLLVALVGVAVVSILANQATTAGFRHFLAEDVWSDLQDSLVNYYARQGSWVGVESLLTAVQPGRGQGGTSLTLLDENGQVVAGAGGQRNRPTSTADSDISLPLLVNGQQAGTLLIRTAGMGNSRAGENFLSEVNRAIILGGVSAVLLALFLGVFLAHRLTRPLRQLTQATHRMAAGDLKQQVTVTSQDELGELASSFNQMAADLEKAEQQRQRLLADVAHELRTPISVMRGHLEAMLDGVFETTPENLAVAHEETILLGRLVEDLRVLSLADAGQLPLNLSTVDLGVIVNQTVASFAPLAEADEIQLTAAVPDHLPPVSADSTRIQQVIGNLVANALRYAEKKNGTPAHIHVTVVPQTNTIQVSVADNGPGLSEEAQQRVFDRFWRSEDANEQTKQGSGLGLAICKAIVQTHNGDIWVESQPGEGATFTFSLPLSPQ